VTEFLFPDNTVLCNFAAVERLDLLAAVLNGRGRWTQAVAHEAGKSARVHPCLADIPSEGWLGDPVEITSESEIRQISLIRRAVFGGTDDEPLKHLGEAETCFVIRNWDEFAGSWWISDDREAVDFARRQGITTRETIGLVNIAVVNGDIPVGEAFDLMKKMADQGRSLRLPSAPADLQR
jgi:predicted nucleic acid-binding protein